MKNLMIVSTLVFSSVVHAQTSANAVEKKFFCNSVDRLLEIEMADMALDMESCLNMKTITSGLTPDKTRRLKGYLNFFAPERPSFIMVCQLEYVGAPVFKNIVGGLEAGILCTSAE